MLPFLKKKADTGISGVIIKNREPDETSEESSDEVSMKSMVSELIDAIHSRNNERAEQALRDIFQELEEQPHVEGEHIEEEEI